MSKDLLAKAKRSSESITQSLKGASSLASKVSDNQQPEPKTTELPPPSKTLSIVSVVPAQFQVTGYDKRIQGIFPEGFHEYLEDEARRRSKLDRTRKWYARDILMEAIIVHFEKTQEVLNND